MSGPSPEPISSTRNARVVAAARLHRSRERRRTGRTLVEGPHLVAEAIASGVEVESVFALEGDDEGRSLAEAAGAELLIVTDPVLRRLADTENPRGPVAVVVIPEASPSDRDVLAIDVGDPGNAGTLIRAAAAFGYAVSCGPRAADPWSPKVIRASAGSVFGVRPATDGWMPEGAITVATVVRGGVDPRAAGTALDPRRQWVILVGDEAHGLAPETVEAADVTVTVPMPGGTESLNAAVAGAIVAYELHRLRSPDGPERADG